MVVGRIGVATGRGVEGEEEGGVEVDEEGGGEEEEGVGDVL